MIRYFIYISLLVFCCSVTEIKAQVLINEISSAGTPGFVDEDGDAEDWVELYNTTGSVLNLQGYSISAIQNGKTQSWTFPTINIQPNEFVTVFCSEKNRNTWFDHWEVPVFASDNTWRYYPVGFDPPSAWRDLSYNDSFWPTGYGQIGYGDGDDSTVVAPCNALFLRKSFVLADTSKIATAAILIDFDDAFVAYLNGVEIARFGIGIQGDFPSYADLAYDEHEAQMYSTGNFSGAYFISPELIKSAMVPGTNVFSIQVHNYGGGMDDLSCIPYFLIGVKDASVTYYPFPAEVYLHTSFNLNSGGTQLVLKNPAGTVIDDVTIADVAMGHSRGRTPDAGTAWCLFNTPTPDTLNTLATCFNGYGSAIDFSLAAGFYSGIQSTTLSCTTPGVIRYTRNGDDPTPASPIYSASINIDTTQVIRARVFPTDPNLLPGPIATRTYFINENVSLPVVSLSSDNYNLFDWYYGIYVLGPGADTTDVPFHGANFWQGWERPAHVEFFENNELQFKTSSGIKIQGNFSKAWPQRGFTIKAKDNYGGDDIHYPLFPDKPEINTYKSFNVRNAGSDWNTCHMRDRFNQKVVQTATHIDIMDGRPCVLFLNGQYWGVYELRERQDANYIQSNTGYDKDSIDFLEFDGNIIEGSNEAFLDMATFIYYNDMSTAANYDSARAMLDIENFCDYIITETHIVNIDWLGDYTNNIKYWRSNNPQSKWRYMLWDTDVSLGLISSFDGADTTHMLHRAIAPPTMNPHSAMLQSLLNNTEFRHYFVNRYADLLNTIYLPEKLEEKAYDLRDEMMPEMDRHFLRWDNASLPDFWEDFIGRSHNTSDWTANIDTMLMFAGSRHTISRNHIQEEFSLAKQVDVTLKTEPADAGTIGINTIEPGPYPWTGVYFDGVPVTITATEKPGYKFAYWKSEHLITTENTNRTITLNVDSNEVFTAYFEPYENFMDAYPNPFSSELTIVYEVPDQQQASLILYDMLGNVVDVILSYNTFQEEGIHTITYKPKNIGLSNGMYILKYKTGEYSRTIKLIHAAR